MSLGQETEATCHTGAGCDVGNNAIADFSPATAESRSRFRSPLRRARASQPPNGTNITT
jgi:hypothetical protein